MRGGFVLGGVVAGATLILLGVGSIVVGASGRSEVQDRIADEQKSVLIKRMQTLLAVAVTEQARKSGVVGTCAMPGWLQQAERGFSNELRQSIGKAAYDGNPVIDYQAWLLELSSDLRAAGMGRG